MVKLIKNVEKVKIKLILRTNFPYLLLKIAPNCLLIIYIHILVTAKNL